MCSICSVSRLNPARKLTPRKGSRATLCRFPVAARPVRSQVLHCEGKDLLRLVFVALALSSAVATSVSAVALLYDCTMIKRTGNADWISNKVGIVLAPNGGATVSDSVIFNHVGEPIAAKRVRNRSERLNVRWTVQTVDSNNQRASMQYEAQIDKGTGAIRLYAKPSGYLNRFSGRGACVVKTAG